MRSIVKEIVSKLTFLAFIPDLLLFPLYAISTGWLRIVKFIGFQSAPLTSWTLGKVGVFPIVDHYYEPFYQFSTLSQRYEEERVLSGIDWRVSEQLQILKHFNFESELNQYPLARPPGNGIQFFHDNGSFSHVDAEYLYSFIRLKKPRRVMEIGSGYSTLIIQAALRQNRTENGRENNLTCIEPFEMPWLESTGATILRKKVESIELSFFEQLEIGDILFIDSTHVIKPEGDVLFELFSVLPRISSGVYIHFHDIFSPHHYPKTWLTKEHRLWNEQYVLEAFLMHNSSYQVVGAVHYLEHKYPNHLYENLSRTSRLGNGGSSLWVQKI